MTFFQMFQSEILLFSVNFSHAITEKSVCSLGVALRRTSAVRVYRCVHVLSLSLCVFRRPLEGITAETVEAAQAPTSKRKEKAQTTSVGHLEMCSRVCETCNSCALRQGD